MTLGRNPHPYSLPLSTFDGWLTIKTARDWYVPIIRLYPPLAGTCRLKTPHRLYLHRQNAPG